MIFISLMQNDFFAKLSLPWFSLKTYFGAETKKHSLLRYIILSFFIVAYFVYESKKLGTTGGFLVTILTWSFFVFCTPVADAGFILAFPIRLLIGVRMVYTQIASYFIATMIVLLTLTYQSAIYNTNLILRLFHTILVNPNPYWLIMIISLIGTLMSIYFGDELIDVSHYRERQKYHRHLNKYKIVATIFIVVLTIDLYSFLLHKIGLQIPLM